MIKCDSMECLFNSGLTVGDTKISVHNGIPQEAICTAGVISIESGICTSYKNKEEFKQDANKWINIKSGN